MEELHMNRRQIKAMINLSSTFEEANEVIEKYAELSNSFDYAQKLAFLKGMFDCQIVGRSVESTEADYVAMLTSIVEQKWK